MLFSADLVVAELSTANLNAIFEPGVRHALKPRATIIMAENKFIIPFDANGNEFRSALGSRRPKALRRTLDGAARGKNRARAGPIPSCGKHSGRDAPPVACRVSGCRRVRAQRRRATLPVGAPPPVP
jgi:hypothetical protein